MLWVLPVLLWDRRPHMCSRQGQYRVGSCEVMSPPHSIRPEQGQVPGSLLVPSEGLPGPLSLY